MIKIIRDNRGQASAELILATVVFLIISMSFVNLISGEMDKTQTGELGQARVLGEKIAETINTVYINGKGYSANLNLPDSFDYKVYVNNTGYLNMEYNNQNITIKLIPVNCTNPVTMNPGESYIVRNVNGTITFIPN